MSTQERESPRFIHAKLTGSLLLYSRPADLRQRERQTRIINCDPSIMSRKKAFYQMCTKIRKGNVQDRFLYHFYLYSISVRIFKGAHSRLILNFRRSEDLPREVFDIYFGSSGCKINLLIFVARETVKNLISQLINHLFHYINPRSCVFQTRQRDFKYFGIRSVIFNLL